MLTPVVVLGGGVIALVALGRALQSSRRHPTTLTYLGIRIVDVAVALASERGHRPILPAHLALALLSDPEVADALEARGVSVEVLYADIEQLLPPRADPIAALATRDDKRPLDAVFSKLDRQWSLRSLGILDALLRSDEDVLRAFSRHGITSERWPRPARVHPEPPPVSNGSPYREICNNEATTDVVFWNDTKTTLEFVRATLRETFGLTDLEATRTTLSIDRSGAGVVGTYSREDAERLARTAMKSARSSGFPLLVSAEPKGRIRTMSRLARYRRRREIAATAVDDSAL